MGSIPRLGEILLEAGVIDLDQLDQALTEQRQCGHRLGTTLIKLGMVDEQALVRALARQLGLPVASLSDKPIAPDVLALVPPRVAREHGVIPLFVKPSASAGQLFLGMEDPSNLQVLDDLCFRTGLEVQPVMVGPSELLAAIDRYYGGSARPADTAELAPDAAPLGEHNLTRVPPEIVIDDEPAEAPESVAAAAPDLAERLLGDVERALDDNQKTRLVVKALIQLLVDREILSLEELQTKLAALKQTEGES